MRSKLITLTIILLVFATPVMAAETFLDGTNTEVPFGLNAERIVSLAPNVTEMLFFLGLGEQIVGCSDFCNYPPEALELPRVGGFADTSLEGILALSPDLVVAYQGNSLELIAQLRQLGIPVVAFAEAGTLEEVGTQMDTLWNIAGDGKAGQPVDLILWRGRLNGLTLDGYPDESSFRCFFGYPGDNTFTCGPGTFVSDLMLRAGAANIATDIDEDWAQVNAEYIIMLAPDYILTGTSCTADEDPQAKLAAMLIELRESPVWSGLPAVERNHLIILDSDVLLRPGPRLIVALEQLNSAFTNFVVNDLVAGFEAPAVEPIAEPAGVPE